MKRLLFAALLLFTGCTTSTPTPTLSGDDYVQTMEAALATGVHNSFLTATAQAPTWTAQPTYTPLPTSTPYPTYTLAPTYTVQPSATAAPTYTPRPTNTMYPTWTMQPSITPSYTPTPDQFPRRVPRARAIPVGQASFAEWHCHDRYFYAVITGFEARIYDDVGDQYELCVATGMSGQRLAAR